MVQQLRILLPKAQRQNTILLKSTIDGGRFDFKDRLSSTSTGRGLVRTCQSVWVESEGAEPRRRWLSRWLPLPSKVWCIYESFLCQGEATLHLSHELDHQQRQ